MNRLIIARRVAGWRADRVVALCIYFYTFIHLFSVDVNICKQTYNHILWINQQLNHGLLTYLRLRVKQTPAGIAYKAYVSVSSAAFVPLTLYQCSDH